MISIATFQVCFILIPILVRIELTPSVTQAFPILQLSPITSVVADMNRTQLLFSISKRISEKNRETAAHLHSHKIKICLVS